MPTFFIQEKPFGASSKTIVQDQSGQTCYLLSGRLGDLGSRLTLYDSNGKALAYIKKDLLAFVRRFEIYENNNKVGTMQKFLNWPNDFYYISHLPLKEIRVRRIAPLFDDFCQFQDIPLLN